MALFTSGDLKDTIKKLANKEFDTPEERDEMLSRVASTEGVRARDVTWMLFRPDRALRETAAKVLLKVKDPETFDIFLVEMRGKPEAAVRAAVPGFFALNIPGIEQRVAQVLAPPQKETKETREMQEMARRLVLEAPMTKQFEAILWQLASAGASEERALYLNKLAGGTNSVRKSGAGEAE